MKSEVKNLVQRCQGLESFQVDCNKKVSVRFRILLIHYVSFIHHVGIYLSSADGYKGE